MKFSKLILSALSLSALISCVGKVEPISEGKLIISAAQPYISVSQGESLDINVYFNSVDVTDQAQIFLDSEPLTPPFVASASGEYTLTATYDGFESENHLTIRAYDDSELTGEFFRRNLVMKFTGTWCVNCPTMGDAIEEVEHNNPFRIVEIAMHSDDELSLRETGVMMSEYGFDVLPVVVTDLDKGLISKSKTASAVLEQIDLSSAKNPAVSSVKLSTSLEGQQLTIDASVKVSQAGNYKLGVVVIADGYAFAQSGADASYRQNRVLKNIVTELYGDSIGALSAGDEITKNYITTLPSDLPGECRVVAYVLNECSGVYLVNNITECVAGKSIDYIYCLTE